MHFKIYIGINFCDYGFEKNYLTYSYILCDFIRLKYFVNNILYSVMIRSTSLNE